MDEALYQVVLSGEIVSGFSREAALASLARIFQTSAARLVPALDGGDYAIDDLMTADEAAALQQRLERVGVQARLEQVASGQSRHPRTGLRLPRQDYPVEAGLMHCPACGHQQLVAKSCDECGVVFAEFNRQRAAAQRAAAGPSPPTVPPGQRPLPDRPTVTPRRPRDVYASATAGWREGWLDEGDQLPTEQYHLQLFMGRTSPQLTEPCQKMMLGRRTRLTLSWVGGAVFSPFLWAMYRKMWGWGLVIFLAEILLPVVLITSGAKQGVSDKLILVGLGLLVANRIFWPAILKSLYCRHARHTIQQLHRMAPTFASDIEVATRGGTSRTSVFVGLVLATVASLLAWSIVDMVHARWMAPAQAFAPAPQLPRPDTQPKPADAAVATQNELLINENKWVATRNRLRTLGQQISSWFVSAGATVDPTGLDLAALARLVPLAADSLLDGWGREVAYHFDGQGYRLVSAGPDGEFGNSDDIEYRRIVER